MHFIVRLRHKASGAALGLSCAVCFVQPAGVFAGCGAVCQAKILASLKIKINVFRCDVAEFSDNLAGYKRVICLNVKILQQNAPARSYEKAYNLAGVLAVQCQCNALSISALHLV